MKLVDEGGAPLNPEPPMVEQPKPEPPPIPREQLEAIACRNCVFAQYNTQTRKAYCWAEPPRVVLQTIKAAVVGMPPTNVAVSVHPEVLPGGYCRHFVRNPAVEETLAQLSAEHPGTAG